MQKRTISNELIRNSAKLLSANVIAQVLGLAVYPILTRLYSSADFGLLTLFTNIGSIMALIATTEYQFAVVLAKDDCQADSLVQLSVGMVTLFSLILLLLTPFSNFFASVFSINDSAWIFHWLPLFVFLTGLWNVLNMYFTRKKHYSAVSGYKMSYSLLQAGSKLGFGYGGFLRGGLIWSTVLAPLVSIVLSIIFRLNSGIRNIVNIDKSAIREVAYSYRWFPMFSLPTSMANTLGLAIPALLLTHWFSLTELGYFSMAITLALNPISLVVVSFQQVLFQQTSDAVNEKQPILQRLSKITKHIVLIVVPCFAVLYFILPTLTGWLLGEEWCITGEYIRLMLPWLLFRCLNGTLSFVIDVFMEQRKGFIFESSILIARIIGLMTGVYCGSFYVAIAGYCIVSAIGLACQLAWFYYLICQYENSLSQ